MWLVKFSNMDNIEFNAVDIEDLMLLIAEYVGEDKEFFRKAMQGFQAAEDKETQYIRLFNSIFARHNSEDIVAIYKIEAKYKEEI